MKYIKLTLVTLILFFTFSLNVDAKGKVTLYFFHGDGCPHCAEEEEFLSDIEDKYKDTLEISPYEVWYNFENQRLMKYRIEEAIIVETIETEPHFRVETVVPERIDKPKRKPENFIESLFDMLFDSIDLFGAFGEAGAQRGDELFGSDEEIELDPEPEIETAIIIETHERVVQEQYFLIYEIEE